MARRRRAAALQYGLTGRGVEIGALDAPLRPEGASVTYVDRLKVSDLLLQYPELLPRAGTIVEADVVCDGETLPDFASASQDFVIANHFLEHCPDPLRTLSNHARVVSSGGVLFYALPIKQHCFDHRRENTTFDHLVRDYLEGPSWSEVQHFMEWAEFVNGLSDPDEIDNNARTNMKNKYSIHYHVWDNLSARLFFIEAINYLNLPLRLEHFEENGSETLTILRKQ